jgi:hypothetical protein
MERECFLSILIVLAAGIAILGCGWWPLAAAAQTSARQLEVFRWKQVWLPLIPAVIVAAWLCGWALLEPDPTPESPPMPVILAAVPFMLLFARALIRAGWSLFRDEGELGTATVGLVKPWILFSPYLARALDDAAIGAALEHERAHARHRDPLRIWLAQVATDLQWPWPQASKRFRQWILALELARDEEARSKGIAGADLASAVLTSVRFRNQANQSPIAALTGEPSALEERITRLLNPLPEPSEERNPRSHLLPLLLAPSLLLAAALGSVFGESVIDAVLRIAA